MYDEISANALSAKKQFTYVALRGVRITLRVSRLYDDELCPSRTSGIGGGVGTLGMIALGAVISTFVGKKNGVMKNVWKPRSASYMPML